MASRSPPSSPTANSHTSDLMRMMESVLTAMQQQNAALVQQNIVALQHLETARLSAEVSQRQYVDLMASGDLKLMVVGFCIKQFPSLVERAKVLEKTKMEVERQQPNVGGPVSSRSSLGPKRTPIARPSSSEVRGQSSRPPLPFGQQTVPAHIRCFTCGGLHY
ncbi:hypothetical protein LR48_Vigan10g111100 [Vigna angularis]|uniref:Uncharacterized protein n=1 Tax=Phaseolus angularis TaxID=3914 RepID=A0A0L9VKF5_PHAAN|nr:hypothetical protein LR48_Vigan10g111100 [Vigna angularis]